MADRSGVSVCMAAYNGKAFVQEQLQSVLDQLDSQDEVIIVDDASRDDTLATIAGIQDERVRTVRHVRNLGVIRAFEHALREASREVILLCDQDDIWLPDKVDKMMRIFDTSPSITLVLTNGELMDALGRPLGRTLHPCRSVQLGAIANLIRNRYQGSAMAFRRELLDAVLPFPDGIPMHDAWIGIVNAIVGRAAYIPDKLMLYRQHENSLTRRSRGPACQMVTQRWRLMINILRRSRVLLQVRKHLRKQPWRLHNVPNPLIQFKREP